MNRTSIGIFAIIGFAAFHFGASPAFAQISLGTSQSFAVLGGSMVTNTGASAITGDVGVSPGTSVIGFPPGTVTGGAIHAGDAMAAQAQTDLATAYSAAAATACNVDLTGQDLGGLTLTPDVYCLSSGASLTGTLTLDFQGNPNAVFLFQIASTLLTGSASSVLLINSGGTTCPANLFWKVGGSATLGTGSTFVGSILAFNSITLTSGASLSGRALARNGSVTLDTNAVTVCAPAVVCPVITVSPATLPNSSAGIPYNLTVTGSGGVAPYTFAVTSGALPNGLTLNGATGSITGTPLTAGTFDFTMTVTDSNACPGSRAYTIVNEARQVAQLSISAFPSGMLQTAGSGGTTDRFVISNFGGLTSDITISSSADFFTQTPTSFRLAAGESRVVSITGLPKPANTYEGTSVITATNFPAQITVPVKLLSAEPPPAEPDVRVNRLSIEVLDITGVNEPGSVELTNRGAGVARGILVSDADWLLPQTGTITVNPGQSTTASFTIDDARRPELGVDANTITASLSFVYLKGGAGKAFGPLDTGSTTGQTQTQVNSSQFPNASVGSVPPLSFNEVAWMVPGIVRTSGYATQFSMFSGLRSGALQNFRLFYLGASVPSSAARFVNVSSLPYNIAYSVSNIVGVFGESSGVGTVQIRGSSLSGLIPSARAFKVDDSRGTVGYSIPVARSDRAAARGTSIVLTGIRKAPGIRTDIYLQEMSGNSGVIHIDFVDSRGTVIQTRNESMAPFAFLAIANGVPEGSAAAFVAVDAGSPASIYAVALVTNEQTSDAGAIADWGRLYGRVDGPVVIPLVMNARSGTATVSRTELTLTNRVTSAASGELRYFGAAGSSRKRPVMRGSSGKGLETTATVDYKSRAMTFGPRETITIDDVAQLFGGAPDTTAYVVFVPATGAVALSAAQRIAAASGGSIGSTIPALPTSAGLKLGERRQFASIEDGGSTAVAQRLGGTYSNSFGLVETTGNDVTVRATIRYGYSFSGSLFARGEKSKEYRLTASASLMIPDLAADLIGPLRESLRDLHGVELDVEVIGGTGAVIPFVLSTDNGTRDLVFRIE